MLNIGSAVGYLLLDKSNFTESLQQASKELEVFQKDTASAQSKFSGVGKALETVGANLTKNVTLPLVGVGTVAVTTAAEFEEKMSKVQAISGAIAEEMELLTDKAMVMGAKTKFSAAESADAFNYMAMAGWKTEDMLNGIEGIMSLAAASGEDLALTSDIVTDALTAFGEGAGEAGRLADILAAASSNSNTNVAMMGETFKYAAPVAGALGISMEDTALAVGLMANSGIKASQAGTTLRAVLTRLSTNAGATKNSLGALEILTEKLGVEFYNVDGTVRDLSSVLEETREAWKGLTMEEQTNYAKKIAGTNAISGFLALMNAEEADYNKLSEAINGSTGAADEMASTMMDNLNGALEQLGGAVETLMIQLGNVLIPTIRDVAEFITVLVEKITQMDEETINTIVQIGAFVAALGPALLVVGKFASAIGTIISVVSKISGVMKTISGLTSGFNLLSTISTGVSSALGSIGSAISMILTPVGAVVAIVGALTAAFIYLWNTNDEFRARIIEIWNDIKSGIIPVVENLKESFLEFKDKIVELWNNIVEAVSPALEALGGLLSSIGEKIMNTVAPAIGDLVALVGGVLFIAFSALVGVIQTVLSAIINFGQVILSSFQAVSSLIQMFVALVQENTTLAKQLFLQFVTSVKDMFLNFVKAVLQFFVDLFSNVLQNLIDFFAGMDTQFGDWIAGILQKLADFGSDMLQKGKDIMNNLWEGLKSAWNSVKEWFGGIIEEIGGFLGEVFGAQSEAGSAVMRAPQSSNAIGLSYVPFDGYRATLHKGERVLTADEAEEYNGGRASGNTFIFNSPKQIDERQAQRLLEQTLYDMES